MLSPPLLILDIDETLIHASDAALNTKADFMVGNLHVYTRPGLDEFLKGINESYTFACWSSATQDYLEAILHVILPCQRYDLQFVWDRSHCLRIVDFENQDEYYLKDLRKLKRQGFDLTRVLILEDEPRKVTKNYGNALYVRPFFGDPSDDELPRLAAYLTKIATQADFRQLEKRGWRA